MKGNVEERCTTSETLDATQISKIIFLIFMFGMFVTFMFVTSVCL